ncbi:hypothetical protein ACFQL0_05120 [Haloplanus litoreus]|uniref:hypothetical protein n=1 Tax=Haloplanus litoreus TaxID=767515 RepID=UPI0036099814
MAARSLHALNGREASVCEDCGYVGIPAEHRGAPKRVESWNDALRRYYRAHDADTEPGVELRPPLSRPTDGSDGESWEDALRRFYARRTPENESNEEESTEDESNEEESTEDESNEEESTEDESNEEESTEDESVADETAAPSQSSAGDS